MTFSDGEGYTVVVAGGAGAMGRITVRDLVETAPPTTSIIVADYDLAAARKLAHALGGKRLRAARLDVTNARAATAVFRGAFAVINAVPYGTTFA
jgi:saccharopine dehydrogenase-like NADP-dependent oxidoreductase